MAELIMAGDARKKWNRRTNVLAGKVVRFTNSNIEIAELVDAVAHGFVTRMG
jgi:hypothetical protein